MYNFMKMSENLCELNKQKQEAMSNWIIMSHP